MVLSGSSQSIHQIPLALFDLSRQEIIHKLYEGENEE